MSIYLNTPLRVPNNQNMSKSKIDIAIAHGSFGTNKTMQPLIEAFKTHGVDAVCPPLPTSEAVSRPVGTSPTATHALHSDDAIIFRSTLSDLILKAGKTVLVVIHSAGGIPGTEAITPELEYHTRQTHGLPGGVIGIFFMAAFIVPPGQSQDGFWMGNTNVEDPLANYSLKSYPDRGEYQMGITPFYIALKDPRSLLFQDLEEQEAAKWSKTIVDLAGPQSARLTNASYLRLPTAYMYTKKDKILPFAVQEKMVADTKALGVEVQEYTLDCGHFPHLSFADDTIKNILGFAEAILQEKRN